MPDLPNVEERFIADMTAFLAGLDAGIAKAEEFATACKEAEDAVAAMALAADDAATVIDAAMGTSTRAVHGLRDAFLGAAAAAQGLKGAGADTGLGGAAAQAGALHQQLNDVILDLMAQSRLLASIDTSLGVIKRDVADTSADLMMQTAILRDIRDLLLQSAAAAALLGGRMRDISGGAAAGGAAGGAGLRLFGGWLGPIRLTTNALHWLVMGTLELAATAVPAIVAFTAAAAAMAPTFTGIFDRMNALVIASGSLHGALLNSIGPLHALGVQMHLTQLAVQPDAFIIFGSVIQDLTSRTGAFAGIARQASGALATFATDVTSFLQGSGGSQLAGFFAGAVHFMSQWLQVLGDLGITFMNVMHSMFGVGHLILDVFSMIARALAAITSHPLAQWAIGFVAAASALYRFGTVALMAAKAMGILSAEAAIPGFFAFIRILATAIAELGTTIMLTGDLTVAWGAFTDSLAASQFAAGPLLIAMAAIAAGLGIWWAATRRQSTATTQLISRVEAQKPTIANLTGGIVKLSAAQQAQAHAAQQANTQMSRMREAGQGPIFAGRAGMVASQAYLSLENKVAGADKAVQQLSTAITTQAKKLTALETGLAQTGAGAGIVGHYMNMLSIDTSLADSKVQQMNQAFSDFMNNVTAGQGGLAAFAQSLQNITSVQATTGINNLGRSTATATLSVKQFAAALGQGAVKGSGAWSNFVQVMGSTMPNLVSWLNIARTEGALTGRQYSKAVLDMASAMTKYAKDSPAAQAALVAFAQAQGMNITSFPQLLKAIKTSGASMSDLTKKVNTATIAMSDASKVAAELSAVLSAQEAQAFAAAALKAAGFSQAVYGLIQAEKSGSFHGKDLAFWQNQVATAQKNATAWSEHAARANDANARAMDGAASAAGHAASSVKQSAAQQRAAWDATLARARAYQAFINSMHGTTISVTTLFKSVGGPYQAGLPYGTVGQNAAGTDSAQRGLAVVGERGPELVFMRGGEQVLSHEHSRALIALAGVAGKIPGFQAGTGSKAGQIEHLEDQLTRALAVLGNRLTGATSISAMDQFVHHLLSIIRQLGRLDAIGPDRESDLITRIRHENSRLSELFRDRQKILNQIRKADQYARSVSQAAQQSASISSIMSGAGGGPVSSAFLLASMKIDLAGIRRFDADIKKLEKLGLDRNLLNQIIQMGPAQGDQVAQALINGPLANIKALNATESQIQRASRNLGRGAAEHMFDAGKNAGKGFLSGLKSQERELGEMMRHLADVMADELARALGLHGGHGGNPGGHGGGRNPGGSGGPHAIGRALIQAVGDGAASGVPYLASALQGAAGHVSSALASAAGGGGGGVTEIRLEVPVEVKLDGRVLYKGMQAQALRVERRNPANNLSLRRGRGR